MSIRADFLAKFNQQQADEKAKKSASEVSARAASAIAPGPEATMTASRLFSTWAPAPITHASLRSQGTVGNIYAPQSSVREIASDGRADSMSSWLKGQAAGGPSAHLHATELRDTNKGVAVFSSVPLSRGHVAISLAKDLLVCEGHMYSWSLTYNAVGNALQDCRAPMELKLAVFLICARHEQSSPVAGYVNSLPKVPIDALGGIPADLYGDPSSWGHSERNWADEVAVAEQILIARADAAEELLRTDDLAPHFPDDIFSTEALRWALGNVYSRAFQLGGAMIMLPLIDMLNHAKKGSMRLNCEIAVSTHRA